MAGKMRKMVAVLLAAMAVIIAPVNVYAMSGMDGGIATYDYGQESSCTQSFHLRIIATGVYNAGISVDGTVSLRYRWDEGYTSEFVSGTGIAAHVTHVPDGIAQDGWSAQIYHLTTAGNTIVFKVELSRNNEVVGSAEISYYVDEYGQVS